MAEQEVNYAEYMEGLVARARAAQKIAETYDQERVDELCEACLLYTSHASGFHVW